MGFGDFSSPIWIPLSLPLSESVDNRILAGLSLDSSDTLVLLTFEAESFREGRLAVLLCSACVAFCPVLPLVVEALPDELPALPAGCWADLLEGWNDWSEDLLDEDGRGFPDRALLGTGNLEPALAGFAETFPADSPLVLADREGNLFFAETASLAEDMLAFEEALPDRNLASPRLLIRGGLGGFCSAFGADFAADLEDEVEHGTHDTGLLLDDGLGSWLGFGGGLGFPGIFDGGVIGLLSSLANPAGVGLLSFVSFVGDPGSEHADPLGRMTGLLPGNLSLAVLLAPSEFEPSLAVLVRASSLVLFDLTDCLDRDEEEGTLQMLASNGLTLPVLPA